MYLHDTFIAVLHGSDISYPLYFLCKSTYAGQTCSIISQAVSLRHKIFRVFTFGILPPDTPGYGEPLPHPRGQLACKSDARVGGTELMVGIIADKNYCNNGVLEYQ